MWTVDLTEQGVAIMNPFTSPSLCQLAADRRHLGERNHETSDEYRIRAADFVARAKWDPERKRHLLAMAKTWLRLAARADKMRWLLDRARFASRNPKLEP
jgi:hypothetical protein